MRIHDTVNGRKGNKYSRKRKEFLCMELWVEGHQIWLAIGKDGEYWKVVLDDPTDGDSDAVVMKIIHEDGLPRSGIVAVRIGIDYFIRQVKGCARGDGYNKWSARMAEPTRH